MLAGVLASKAGTADGLLPAEIIADYQLGGAYPPPAGVTVVVRDSREKAVPGIFNICYVNGFQSQPGVTWPKSLLLLDAKGNPIADPNWPDEYFLDISTQAKRESILARLLPSIKGCAIKEFGGVEFDNLDSYTRTNGRIAESDAVTFAKMLVSATKSLGMAAGQKNAPDLAARGRSEIGFTFVVAEECHRWDECAAYSSSYGNQVINIEYSDDLRGTFDGVCADPKTPKSTILRDRLLVPKGAAGYVYRRC
jgi:Glycoside-hydrolase family GH114